MSLDGQAGAADERGNQVVERWLVAGLAAGAGKKRVIRKGEGKWRRPGRVDLSPELVLTQVG